MNTDELREAYLDFFDSKGCVRRPSDVLVPNDPSVLFTPAGMNQFKDQFLGKVQARVHAGHDLPEVPAHRRHRQRRPDRLPPHVLRDAGQLQLRRLLQARGDPLGLGVSDRQEVARASTRPADASPSTSTTTRRPASGTTRSSSPPTASRGWARTTTSGRPARRRNGPDGVCGPCSEIFYHGDGPKAVEIWNLVFTQFNRVGAAEQSRAAAQEEHRHRHGPGARGGRAAGRRRRTSTSTSSGRSSTPPAEQLRRRSTTPTSPTAAGMRRIADHVAGADLLHPRERPPRPREAGVRRSAGCCAGRCSTATRWAGASRSCTSSCRRWPR